MIWVSQFGILVKNYSGGLSDFTIALAFSSIMKWRILSVVVLGNDGR